MRRATASPRFVPPAVAAAAVALVVVVSYLPVATLLAGAVADAGWGVAAEAASVLTQPRRLGLLARTVGMAAGAALAALALGVPSALLLARSDLRHRRLLRGAMLLPLVVPTYVFALGWQSLARALPGGGTEGGSLVQAGVGEPAAAALLLALRYLPLVVLLVAAGLDRVEPELEEAGRLLHPTRWVLARVVLPLVRPQIVASALLVFNLALVNYTVPSLLGVHTFPVEIFAAFSGLLDVGAAVALSLPLLLLGGLSVVLARLAVGRRPMAFTPAPSAHPPLLRLRRSRPLAYAGLLALLAVAVVAPVAGVAGLLEAPGDLVDAYELAAPQVWRTVGWAAVAATLLLAHGFAAGHLVARSRSLAGELLFLLPLALPPTVLGIGMIRLWNRPGLAPVLETTAVLALAYCGQLVPFATVAASSSLSGVPTAQEEAGLLAGMGWLRRARHLLLPRVWPALAVGWVLVFALALSEVGASILVLPPDGETLAVRIYNLSHYGAADTVGALCLLVLALVLVPLAAFGALLRLRGGRARP